MAWSKGHSGTRRCLTCGGLADCKPRDGCAELRHWHRHTTKKERNNAYRKERRAAARADGTVYRKGYGDLNRKAKYNRQRHAEMRDALFEKIGGAYCAACGFSDKRALHFDHKNGGGRRHRKSLPSGSAYYKALFRMSAKELRATFQVLCANCNCIKREEREEWRWRHASEAAEEEDERLPPSS